MFAAEYSWLQVSHHNLNRWDGSRAYVTRLVTLVKIHEISGGGEGVSPLFINFLPSNIYLNLNSMITIISYTSCVSRHEY